MTFFKHFMAALVALASVVGVFLGAIQLEVLWAALVIIVIAGVYGLLRAFSKPLLQTIQRLQAHDRLSSELAEAIADLAAARKKIVQLEDERGELYERGVDEGQARLTGWASAHKASEIALIAVSSGDEGLQLTAQYQPQSGTAPLATGSRFELIVNATHESKGVVEVISVDGDLATLVCVYRTVPRFWPELETRAITDPSPPPGHELRPAGVEAYQGSRTSLPLRLDDNESASGTMEPTTNGD